MRHWLSSILVLSLPALGLHPVLAADVGVAEPVEVPEAVDARDIVLDVGFGALLQPQFPSAEKYSVAPWPLVGLHYLRLPVFGEVVTGKTSVITLYPSFDFIGEREQDDAAYLAGTDDLDFGFDVGPGLAVRYGAFRGFAEVRYGVTGHSGFVGEAGLDVVIDQLGSWQVSAGPRVSVASDDYMDTYFGVPVGAAVLAPYDPDGGIKDIGVALNASYALTEAVRVVGTASWRHYVGDAADSPIVEAGNVDDFTIGLGLTYRFGLDLY